MPVANLYDGAPHLSYDKYPELCISIERSPLNGVPLRLGARGILPPQPKQNENNCHLTYLTVKNSVEIS